MAEEKKGIGELFVELDEYIKEDEFEKAVTVCDESKELE